GTADHPDPLAVPRGPVEAHQEDIVGATAGLRGAAPVSYGETTRSRAGDDDVTVRHHPRSVPDRVPPAAPHLEPAELAGRCVVGGEERILCDHGRIAVAGDRPAAEVNGPDERPGREDVVAVRRDRVHHAAPAL